MNIGILAIQGSFAEHAQMLERMGKPYVLVRSKSELEKVSHLIIPGGESTTMKKLLDRNDMWQVLEERTQKGPLKIMGTCAGAILCSYLGMDLKVDRNGFGAQQSSMRTALISDQFPDMEGVFIRAPRFVEVGEGGTVLARVTTDLAQDEPVMVAQGAFLALSFHPELSDEDRVYAYFIEQ